MMAKCCLGKCYLPAIVFIYRLFSLYKQMRAHLWTAKKILKLTYTLRIHDRNDLKCSDQFIKHPHFNLNIIDRYRRMIISKTSKKHKLHDNARNLVYFMSS